MTDKAEKPEVALGDNLGDQDENQGGADLSPKQVKALDRDGNGEAGGSKKKAKGMPDRTWIILEESDDIPPTGLFVSHNGNPYLIRTGEPVEVPDFLLGILDDAIQSRPVTDPRTNKVIGHRDQMRYSYRRVAAPAAPE